MSTYGISNTFRQIASERAKFGSAGYDPRIRAHNRIKKAVAGVLGSFMVLLGVAQGAMYLSQNSGPLSHVTNVERAVNIIKQQDVHRKSDGMKLDIMDATKFHYENVDTCFSSGDSKVIYNEKNPEEFMLMTRSGDSIEVHISRDVLESENYDKAFAFIEEATRYGVQHNYNVKVPSVVGKHIGVRYVTYGEGKYAPITVRQLLEADDRIETMGIDEATKNGFTTIQPEDQTFSARPDVGPQEHIAEQGDLPKPETHLVGDIIRDDTILGVFER